MKYSWLYCALVVVSFVQPAPANDWTRFRGPDGAGIVEGKYSPNITTKDFEWKVELPGKGHASPVIWKDRIYTTSADPDEGKRFLLCLSTKDGSLLWKKDYNFATFRKHADNSFASATPAVDDVAIYVAWDMPEHYTLMAFGHDGKELWQQDLGSSKSTHGHGASPIVIDDVVILPNDNEGPDSSVCAFDRKTGAPRWKLERPSTDKTSMSTPAVWRPKGGPPQVITSTKGYGFTSFDPKTGNVNWEAKVLDARAVGSPVMTDDLIIGACGDGTNYKHLVACRPPKPGKDAEVVYSFKGIATYVPTPIIKGNRLYMWNEPGQVTCVDVNTGRQIWSEKIGGGYYGSPVCIGDTIWCMSKTGDLVGIAASDTFKKYEKVSLGEPSHATPAVVNGKMYLRTVSHLISVKLKAE